MLSEHEQGRSEVAGMRAALAEVAKTGDPAKTKAAFFSMADACKACHDNFRKD